MRSVGVALSACCFRNFSLAPEPPGVLEGMVGVFNSRGLFVLDLFVGEMDDGSV